MNTFKRFISNAALAYTSTVLSKSGNVLLFIIIGRQYGPKDAGMFNLGITYLVVVLALSAWGLHEILVREAAPRLEQSARYFVNFLLFRLFLTISAYGLLIAALRFLLPYNEITTNVIAIISLAVFPEAVFVMAQALFSAHQQLIFPTAGALISSVFKIGAGYWLISNGQAIEIVVWVIPIGSAIGLLVLIPAILLLFKKQKQRASAMPNLRFCLTNLRLTPGFILIGLFSTLDYQIDTFLISFFFTEQQIGWYGAAQTIVLGFWMVAPAIRLSIFPLFSRYFIHSPPKLKVVYQKSTRYLLLIALPIAAGVTILAEQIILFIYGPSFLPAVPVLQVMIWSIIFAYLAVPAARLILVNNRQKQAGIMTGISMLTNLILNLVMLQVIGFMGAAVARTASTALFYFMLLGYSQRFLIKNSFSSLLRGPFIAVILMSVVVWSLRELPMIVPIIAGALTYGAAALLVGAIPKEDRYYLYKFGSSAINR